MNPHIILNTAFFAPIDYYHLLATCSVEIEQWANYTKQTYANRCHIATANGMTPLSVPIESNSGEKCPIKETRISEHSDWQTTHWRTISSAYMSSPFFEYYADDILPFFTKKHKYLFDLNMEIQTVMLDLLNIRPEKIALTNTFMKEYNSGECIDLRNTIHPKNEYSLFDNYQPTKYYQVFEQKQGFIPHLSILDLLFNMGPEAKLILKPKTRLYEPRN